MITQAYKSWAQRTPEEQAWANHMMVNQWGREERAPKSGDAVTFTSILDIWKLENDHPDTLKNFSRFMAELAEFTGTDDAKQTTAKQIVDFETHLRQEGRLQANSIRNKLSCYKTIFRFAKRKLLIEVNLAEDIQVPPSVDTDFRDFPPALAKRIVSEAQKLRAELYLAILIQSVTGCRVSEILNRQTSDIRLEEGAVVFEIPRTGEGKGKTKSSARIIPVHPAIAPMLLAHRDAVIERHGEGLLFPELPRGRNGTAKPSRYGTRVIDEWFRDPKKLNIQEEHYSSNHSWRHTVKTQLYKAQVDVKTREMIIGHGSNVARRYEHGDIAMMAEAITSTLPNPLA